MARFSEQSVATTMEYLDFARLNKLSKREFRDQKPFPWVNFAGALTPEAHRVLLAELPEVSRFERRFGYGRDHGQKGHDRYSLEYDRSLDVSPHWHAFVRELESARYRGFLRRMLGFRPMRLSYHWHYTPEGCAVSPHCDSSIKLGSHIFYLNTEDDWNADWGGQTVVLDDHGKFDCRSAPAFEEFEEVAASQTVGNYSFIFKRTPKSWHGVRAVQCPEGKLRKVFIVVVEKIRPVKTLRNIVRAKFAGQQAAG